MAPVQLFPIGNGPAACNGDDEMIDTIEQTGPTVSDVRVSAPSLEDVFLSLTGRSMREED